MLITILEQFVGFVANLWTNEDGFVETWECARLSYTRVCEIESTTVYG